MFFIFISFFKFLDYDFSRLYNNIKMTSYKKEKKKKKKEINKKIVDCFIFIFISPIKK